MTTMLSPNFSLEEMVYSATALRHGLDNTPSAEAEDNLYKLCNEILEPTRELLGNPMVIDSGFRSPAVNVAVGSTSKHSDHLDGNAADFVPLGMDLRAAFDRIRTSDIPFKQVIIECGAWIHISRGDDAPQREALLAYGGPGNWTYERVV